MQGPCDFENTDYDYYDYDFDDASDTYYSIYGGDTYEDYRDCLQWCKQRAKLLDNAVGCYFQKTSFGKRRNFGDQDIKCVFIKDGAIVQKDIPAQDDGNDVHICWKFQIG